MLRRYLPILGVVFLCCDTSWLQGQTVSFIAHGHVLIGAGCCVVAAGDFNGDGKLDLVVGDGTGSLALLLGDGAGGFKPKIELATFSAAIAKPVASDVNRDGKLDLIVGTSPGHGSEPQTYVLLGRGDGTFQAPQLVASGYPLFVADLNGDGIPDLVTVGGTSGPYFCADGFQVQLGNGDGTFQQPRACTTEPDGGISGNAGVGDFNGDGKLDFAWSNTRSNGTCGLFLGNGDGTFRLVYPGFGISDNGAIKPLAVGDLNHDGKLDVVVGRNWITVFLGNGDGTFQIFDRPGEGIVIPLDFQPSLFVDNSIFIADFNGDGKLDIATDNAVVPGNGDGTFQPPQYFVTASPNASSLIAGDLNGDGLPDLVYVNYDLDHNATTLSILLNNTPALPTSVVGHSAATGAGPVAPSSIGSVYGKNLARVTAAAGPTLPTQLSGISLQIRDAAGIARLAPLFYVSPSQINFLVPDQTALGLAVLTIVNGSGPPVETLNATVVSNVAPGIFTANGQGQGAAAATATRILADGSQQPVAVFNCAGPGQCTTVPMDLGGGRPVYLSLYGTGLRSAQASAAGPPQATCQVGGVNAVLQFLGAQPTIPGLDQINLLLPASLPSGAASVQCQFLNGIVGSPAGFPTSNPVQIAIK